MHAHIGMYVYSWIKQLIVPLVEAHADMKISSYKWTSITNIKESVSVATSF